MAILVEATERRCPRCHKKLYEQIGQDDTTGAGDMRAVFECWSCNYSEDDIAWSRPLGTDGWSSAAKRLMRLRGLEPQREDANG